LKLFPAMRMSGKPAEPLLLSIVFIVGFVITTSFLFRGTPNFNKIDTSRPETKAACGVAPDKESAKNPARALSQASNQEIPTTEDVKARIELWSVLAGFQSGFWLVAAVLVARWFLWDLRDDWRGRLNVYGVILAVANVSLLLVAVLLFFKAFVIPWNSTAGAPSAWKVGEGSAAGLGGMGVLGLLVGSIPALGIGLIHNTLATPDNTLTVESLLRLRNCAERMLMTSALILALASLGVAALTSARKADFCSAPREYVIIHGALYSVLLVLVYAPTHKILIGRGRNIRAITVPLPPPDSEEWKRAYDKHKALSEVLRLEFTGLASWGVGFPILLPLFTSLVSTFLKN
jgi:hypothetical protein